MSAFHDNALMGASGSQGYQISRSVRLRSSASAYFSRTPASASNRRTWTWSGWVKRGSLGANQVLMSSDVGTSVNTWAEIGFTSADALQVTSYSGQRNTTAIYRDPSAWYHIVVAFDTTQSVEVDRVKFYVNGVLNAQTGDAGFPAQNTDYGINNNQAHDIGRRNWASGVGRYFDGYLTEVNFIDGQALTPTSFGQFNSVTGVWQPLKYTGTYGTNGFYLNFSDNSNNTAATIGKDYSGNGNNWTPNNISVTAGVAYDSMLDVPTPYADGGNGRGNYCTLNPVFKNANSTYGVMATPISGNLESSMGAGTNLYGTQGLFGSKGKWYAECRPSSIVSQVSIGYLSDDGNLNRGAWINSSSGVLVDNASKGTAGFAAGNIIGIAYDSINNTVQFYVNGSAVGSAYSTSTTSFNEYLFWSYTNSGVYVEWNFGQRPFSYTPPSGFKALNTQNLPDSTIKKGNQYFDATTYTGNGSTQSIVNSGGMQPDLVWYKSRGAARDHSLFDSVRGATNQISSNATYAESAVSGVTAFNSNGFSLGSSANGNNSSESYVGWQWKESATAGFDIVTYTGNGTNRTIAHSLGVAPSMIIIKCRDSATDPSWIVGHTGIGMGTGRLILNGTDANSNAGASSLWNSTAANSSVFSLGTYSSVNQNTLRFVAYLFSEVAGFSRMGSFTGNGSSDGPFLYCGFRPRWIMVKRTDTSGYYWWIVDTARNTYNALENAVYAQASDAETTGWYTDSLANGFKIRNSGLHMNASGGTYIYAAFAENPFKNALAR